MRLRNVKNATNILGSSKYYISNESYPKGNWKDVFANDRPIMLEIGMGKGEFLIGMAKSHPEYNFIGVEKYESVLVRAVQKLDLLKLDNVKVINIDALDLSLVFDHEIDSIYLNFSDPWPKKKHHKRRLTYETFLKVYDKLFIGFSKIIMKTDNDGLFEGSIVSLSQYGYVFDEIILDLWNSQKENIMTEYEKKFGQKGFKIKYLYAHKNIEENGEV